MDADFQIEASEYQHVQWLKRNAKKEWVEDHQRVAWEDLDEDNKRKNTDIVSTAVKVWIANNKQNALSRRSSSLFEDPPSI